MVSSRNLRAFKKWMKWQHVECSDALDVVVTMNSVSVRALCDLNVGDLVATIPKESCLTAKTSGARQMIEESELEGILALAIAIMYERSLGPLSPWFGYLQLLPYSEPIPLLWSLSEIDSLLAGTELHKVFFLCLLAGCSITWFNTVCFVLCIKNFPCNRPLALALTVSFNGVSAALYNLAAISINPCYTHIYLLLNALIPLFTCIVSLVPILRQPPVHPLSSDIKHEQLIFVVLNLLALVTGLYLLFVHSNDSSTTRVIFAGSILLLVLPLGIPGIIYARDWYQHKVFSSITLLGSGFLLVDADDLEFHKEFLSRESSQINVSSYGVNGDGPTLTLSLTRIMGSGGGSDEGCCGKIIGKDQLFMLGEEHKVGMLVKRVDFWLYYLAYFCGGTIGLVYSNNLGQIAQSLGHSSMTSTLITLYSSFSFFGRLFSAAPDFIRLKFYFARTGWLALALVPTPIAFFLLAASGNELPLQAGTALIGLSSGFIFAAAVSITSELFGPNSVGVNHNILITNIPIGSLVYGFLAALIYDNNAAATFPIHMVTDSVVCMGRKCYFSTFIWWGFLALLGLISSVLFLRTRPAYERFEQNRTTNLLD